MSCLHRKWCTDLLLSVSIFSVTSIFDSMNNTHPKYSDQHSYIPRELLNIIFQDFMAVVQMMVT